MKVLKALGFGLLVTLGVYIAITVCALTIWLLAYLLTLSGVCQDWAYVPAFIINVVFWLSTLMYLDIK